MKTVVKEFYQHEENLLYSHKTNEVKQTWSSVSAANKNYKDSFSVSMTDVNTRSTNSSVSFGPVHTNSRLRLN